MSQLGTVTLIASHINNPSRKYRVFNRGQGDVCPVIAVAVDDGEIVTADMAHLAGRLVLTGVNTHTSTDSAIRDFARRIGGPVFTTGLDQMAFQMLMDTRADVEPDPTEPHEFTSTSGYSTGSSREDWADILCTVCGEFASYELH
jgi:hypothetical protein